MTVDIRVGDCLDVLRTLADKSVQMCVTSPPYFGLRDYGVPGQIGQEPTPGEFVAKLADVFREVRRVLRDDGTLWLNLGDSYAGSGRGAWNVSDEEKTARGVKEVYRPKSRAGGTGVGDTAKIAAVTKGSGDDRNYGLKPKDLIGIPWRVALALQEDGWFLRADIIWHKPNPMPESVTDRPTKAHEYLFLLSKSPTYYYDTDAIAERGAGREKFGNSRLPSKAVNADRNDSGRRDMTIPETRNRRSVWTVATHAYPGSHFATFPPKLIEPCILAGSRIGDTVLDPFGGAGTTGLVASRLGRHALLIELNPAYAEMARRRIHDDAPLFSDIPA